MLMRKGRIITWAGISLHCMALASAQQLSPQKSLQIKLDNEGAQSTPVVTGSQSLTGRLVTKKSGEVVFRPAGSETEIPVASSEDNPFKKNTKKIFDDQNTTGATTEALVATVPVTLTYTGTDSKPAEVSSSVATTWNEIRPKLKDSNLINQLDAKVEAYEAKTKTILTGGTNGWTDASPAPEAVSPLPIKPEELKTLQTTIAKETEKLIATQPETLKNDLPLLADLYASSEPDQLFGNYGPVSVSWSLSDLQRFVKAARSVASINHYNDIKGSGFLIGKGLLLTCEHVIQDLDLNLVKVAFPAENPEGEPLVLKVEETPILKSSETSGSITSTLSNRKLKCDFALLKLKDSDRLSVAGITPLPLSRNNVLNAVVAVAGYPVTNKKLRIHENGTMIFPYELPRGNFQSVFMQRIYQFLKSPPDGDNAAFQSQVQAVRNSFHQAYGYDAAGPPKPSYFYVGRTDKWKDVPTFGVDSSTTHGDSGGPVFDKSTLQVIGMLRGGTEESFPSASWFAHDKAIPISEIIDTISQAKPDILTDLGVNIIE